MDMVDIGCHQPFDSRALRDVLGCYATGVAVVTTVGDKGSLMGLVVNSFSSVSLDPPLILWSIGLSSPSLQAFQRHPGFAINIMGADDKEKTLQFAQPSDDKFKDIAWRPGRHGVPVLDKAIATLECEMHQRMECGDHEIIIGKVVQIDRSDGRPLLFHRGQFADIGTVL